MDTSQRLMLAVSVWSGRAKNLGAVVPLPLVASVTSVLSGLADVADASSRTQRLGRIASMLAAGAQCSRSWRGA